MPKYRCVCVIYGNSDDSLPKEVASLTFFHYFQELCI